MDKKEILDKYKKIEDKLAISKFFDKVELCRKNNKIETTDFLNELEQKMLMKVAKMAEIDNCVFYGGKDDSERKVAIMYPEKMEELFENNCFNYNTVFSVFRIQLEEDDAKTFNHSVYLGGIIKLGIKREKIGDILVRSTGADIIVKKETEKFLYAHLQTLTRFKMADVSTVDLDDVEQIEKKFQDIKLITSSLRLDNIVSELARTSRSKAVDILIQERVLVNYEVECKSTKLVKEKDVVTIRGKGKFIIDEVIGNTKKGNYIVICKKYV